MKFTNEEIYYYINICEKYNITPDSIQLYLEEYNDESSNNESNISNSAPKDKYETYLLKCKQDGTPPKDRQSWEKTHKRVKAGLAIGAAIAGGALAKRAYDNTDAGIRRRQEKAGYIQHMADQRKKKKKYNRVSSTANRGKKTGFHPLYNLRTIVARKSQSKWAAEATNEEFLINICEEFNITKNSFNNYLSESRNIEKENQQYELYAHKCKQKGKEPMNKDAYLAKKNNIKKAIGITVGAVGTAAAGTALYKNRNKISNGITNYNKERKRRNAIKYGKYSTDKDIRNMANEADKENKMNDIFGI